MKATVKVDNKEVTIVLSEAQLADIRRQTSNLKTVDDINSYEDACKILKETVDKKLSDIEKLFTIIRAANYLDNNGEIWEADWTSGEYKYIPYFEYKKSSGWVLSSVYLFYFSYCPGGFYFKKEATAKLIANKFLTLYNKVF